MFSTFVLSLLSLSLLEGGSTRGGSIENGPNIQAFIWEQKKIKDWLN
jgi:hypothetical protein